VIKSAGEILVDEIGKCVANFQRSVTPIFDVNSKGEAKLLGSGVLIEISNNVFLCTAKHVIDRNAKSTLYIDGPTHFEVLQGQFYATAELDVAVLNLSREQVGSLRKYIPLPTDRIAGPAEILSARYANMVGFPETKNRRVYNQNKIGGLLYSVGGIVTESRLEQVRVAFNRKRNIDATTRKRVTAPEPYGMSGGAMFGTPMDAATIKGSPNTQLIAINTEWASAANQIFGPSIAIAVVRETPDHCRAAPTTGSADAPRAAGRWRVAASGKRARPASYGFTEV
jgi:hypothetical protein